MHFNSLVSSVGQW